MIDFDEFLQAVNSLPKHKFWQEEKINYDPPRWGDDRFHERLMRIGFLARYFKIHPFDTNLVHAATHASLFLSFHEKNEREFVYNLTPSEKEEKEKIPTRKENLWTLLQDAKGKVFETNGFRWKIDNGEIVILKNEAAA